jgi:hypothetical protein
MHFAFLVYGERKFPGLVVLGFEFYLFEVEDNIGNVLDYAG